MDPNPERRRYRVAEENVPLSEVVREAVDAHGTADSLGDHVDVESIDRLFTGSDVAVSLRLVLPDVTVSIWNDDGVDIRVADDGH